MRVSLLDQDEAGCRTKPGIKQRLPAGKEKKKQKRTDQENQENQENLEHLPQRLRTTEVLAVQTTVSHICSHSFIQSFTVISVFY